MHDLERLLMVFIEILKNNIELASIIVFKKARASYVLFANLKLNNYNLKL